MKAFLLPRKQSKVGLLSEIQFSDTLTFSGAFFLTLPTLYMSLLAMEPSLGPGFLLSVGCRGEMEAWGLSAGGVPQGCTQGQSLALPPTVTRWLGQKEKPLGCGHPTPFTEITEIPKQETHVKSCLYLHIQRPGCRGPTSHQGLSPNAIFA